MAMSDYITLANGLKILSTTPVGEGGVVLNENFTLLDAVIGEVSDNVDGVPTATPNTLVLRDSGGSAAFVALTAATLELSSTAQFNGRVNFPNSAYIDTNGNLVAATLTGNSVSTNGGTLYMAAGLISLDGAGASLQGNGSGASVFTGAVSATSFSGIGSSLTSLNASSLSSGTVGTARLGSGTASSSTYLRGDQSWASLPAANPTVNVGLSVVDGSATTFMRSDAAPALSQAISPTWTGSHTFSSVLTASSRMLVHGATDDGTTALQVAGDISTTYGHFGVVAGYGNGYETYKDGTSTWAIRNYWYNPNSHFQTEINGVPWMIDCHGSPLCINGNYGGNALFGTTTDNGVDIAQFNGSISTTATTFVSQSTAPSSPSIGTTYYDGPTSRLLVWNGSAWQNQLASTQVQVASVSVDATVIGATNLYTVPTGFIALIDSFSVLTLDNPVPGTAAYIEFGTSTTPNLFVTSTQLPAQATYDRYFIDTPTGGIAAGTTITGTVSTASTATNGNTIAFIIAFYLLTAPS